MAWRSFRLHAFNLIFVCGTSPSHKSINCAQFIHRIRTWTHIDLFFACSSHARSYFFSRQRSRYFVSHTIQFMWFLLDKRIAYVQRTGRKKNCCYSTRRKWISLVVLCPLCVIKILDGVLFSVFLLHCTMYAWKWHRKRWIIHWLRTIWIRAFACTRFLILTFGRRVMENIMKLLFD